MRRKAKTDESLGTKKNEEENNRTPKRTDKSPNSNGTWTYEDKCMLLKALKRYGFVNKEKINALLPNKSPAAIRTKISKIIKEASNFRQRQKAAGYDIPAEPHQEQGSDSHIISWINLQLFVDKDRTTSRALHYISLFEKHPSLSVENKCDYGSIYYFLYCLSLGQVPPELTPETKTVFYSVLSEVLQKDTEGYSKDVMINITKLPQKMKNKRQYPGKRNV